MPKYWLISDRDGGRTGSNRNNNGVTFWVSDGPNDKNQLRDIRNWQRVQFAQFRKAIIEACAQFPGLPPEQQEEGKHLALCIHGYNNGFFADNENDIHGAYFKLDQYASVKTLIREVLRGVDRGVLVSQKIAAPNSWWPNRTYEFPSTSANPDH